MKKAVVACRGTARFGNGVLYLYIAWPLDKANPVVLFTYPYIQGVGKLEIHNNIIILSYITFNFPSQVTGKPHPHISTSRYGTVP